MRGLGLAAALIALMPCAARAEIQGVYQGCWSDYEGNNYCGDAPSGGSYDDGGSYSYGSDDYSAYGDAAYKLGEAVGMLFADAIADMAAAQAAASQAWAFNSQGNEAFARGDYEGAIAAYRQALEYSPTDPYIQNNLRRAQASVHVARGRAYHEQGDLERAIASYREALAYEPSNRAIHQYIRLAEQKQAYEQVRLRDETLRARMAEAADEIRAKAIRLARNVPADAGTDASALALTALPPSAYGPQRGLRIKTDIPLPGSGPGVPPPTLSERAEALQPYVDRADALLDQAKLQFWEGRMWLRAQARDIGMTAVLDKAAAVVPLVGTAQRLHGAVEDTQALSEKVGGAIQETAQGAFGRLERAVSEAADPDQRSTGEDTDAWLESRAAVHRQMAHETYMEKYRGKAQGLLEGFQEQHEALATQEDDGPAPPSSAPILGLKSYDRQRQEYLNEPR
ncbi:MAG TPA: tetratricopeptide repeat protein [bacterium]